jgi:DtxR family Mn-dependent transcriptional regulator
VSFEPLFDLAALLAVCVLAVVLFWPGSGLLSRSLRQRSVSSRTRLEDALKHLYHQEASGRAATVESVSGALGMKPAWTVGLVERMQRTGLTRLTDGRLLLTEEGERYALQVVRAHRLWERYLADETGLDPREWHAAADRREHRITPEKADALAVRLGNPRFDPHGDPIPTAEGELPDRDRRVAPLPELDEDDTATVVHIEDEPDVVYAEILARGVHLGQDVRLVRKDDRRVVFEVEGREITLAPVVAANVSVRAPHDPGEVAVAPERTLAEIEVGERARIVLISQACRGIERRRLMDLGIVPGTTITLEREGMTGGLRAYRVRGTLIALRREQAEMIGIEMIADHGADASRRQAS